MASIGLLLLIGGQTPGELQPALADGAAVLSDEALLHEARRRALLPACENAGVSAHSRDEGAIRLALMLPMTGRYVPCVPFMPLEVTHDRPTSIRNISTKCFADSDDTA